MYSMHNSGVYPNCNNESSFVHVGTWLMDINTDRARLSGIGNSNQDLTPESSMGNFCRANRVWIGKLFDSRSATLGKSKTSEKLNSALDDRGELVIDG